MAVGVVLSLFSNSDDHHSETRTTTITIMAYRRRQGITRASTFKEEIHHPSDEIDHISISSSSSASSSLAAQAIRASAAARDPSHSSVYGSTSTFPPGHLRSKVLCAL